MVSDTLLLLTHALLPLNKNSTWSFILQTLVLERNIKIYQREHSQKN